MAENNPLRGFKYITFCLLIIACGTTGTAWGQLGIDLRATRDTYVKYEPVNLTLILRNYTANIVRFGEEGHGNVLLFATREDDPMVSRKAIGDLFEPFSLGPGETRNLSFSLNSVFPLQKVGEYTVYAQATHPRLRQDFRSRQLSFGVREGDPLWKRQFGLPVADDGATIPSRTLTLLRVHEREGEQLCMRIEDNSHVYAVVRLGKQIFGAVPSCDIDAVSNIHLMLRLKSRLFVYRIYDYSGNRKQQKFYMLEDTRPMLIRDNDTGRISVVGGRPAIEGSDYFLQDGDEAVQATPDVGAK